MRRHQAKGIRSADGGSYDPDYELPNLSFGSRVFTVDTALRGIVRRRRSCPVGSPSFGRNYRQFPSISDC